MARMQDAYIKYYANGSYRGYSCSVEWYSWSSFEEALVELDKMIEAASPKGGHPAATRGRLTSEDFAVEFWEHLDGVTQPLPMLPEERKRYIETFSTAEVNGFKDPRRTTGYRDS